MNDTHFKSAQNLFFLKDAVEILLSPPSILLVISVDLSFQTSFESNTKQEKFGKATINSSLYRIKDLYNLRDRPTLHPKVSVCTCDLSQHPDIERGWHYV